MNRAAAGYTARMLLLLPLLAAAQDELSYSGNLGDNAANYKPGAPVSITHSGGNLQVRCMEVTALNARVAYTVYGTSEGNMKSFGDGVGLAVWGDSKGGGAKTRIPSKGSGVSSAEVTLTVSIPKGTTSVTVSQSGSGWAQVIGCSGFVKVTGGGGGVYLGGPLTGFSASATGGDVKIEVEESTLTSTSTASSPGALTVVLPSAQGGKLSAKGAEVSVQQVVMGTNEPTYVAGEMGIGGPSITLSAKGRVELSSP